MTLTAASLIKPLAFLAGVSLVVTAYIPLFRYAIAPSAVSEPGMVQASRLDGVDDPPSPVGPSLPSVANQWVTVTARFDDEQGPRIRVVALGSACEPSAIPRQATSKRGAPPFSIQEDWSFCVPRVVLPAVSPVEPWKEVARSDNTEEPEGVAFRLALPGAGAEVNYLFVTVAGYCGEKTGCAAGITSGVSQHPDRAAISLASKAGEVLYFQPAAALPEPATDIYESLDDFEKVVEAGAPDSVEQDALGDSAEPLEERPTVPPPKAVEPIRYVDYAQ